MTVQDAARGATGTDADGRKAAIDFHCHDGTYSGTGRNARQWRITACFTGWRLEFRDPGDATSTYAGTHASLAAARTEADR